MDSLSSLTPLEGGWSGRTFLAEAGGERTVVRLYPPDDPRGPAAPEVDAAVLALVRGLVPVPDVLEVRRADAAGTPGILVTTEMAGERGDLVLPRLDPGARARTGGEMGALAATLAGMPTLRGGLFLDAELRIEPFADGLPEWVAAHQAGLGGWSARERDALRDVAVRAQALLDRAGRTCLVHSDLNPKNVLLDPVTGAVTAVLDWEFAHSGHPLTDLGNVVRFDRDPGYVDAAVAAYVRVRGGEPADVLETARAADLWALVELAARPVRTPVTDRAEDLLRGIVATGDLHAGPDRS